MDELRQIQAKLKAPKNQTNKFGGYNYRSCEDILEAVKPLLAEYNALLTISDEIMEVGGRVYVKATATFTCGEFTLSNSAAAREAETKKGMDDSQITGTASSYARKYALNGLFLIDDTKDADSNEYRAQANATATPGIDFKQIEDSVAKVADLDSLDDLGKRIKAKYPTMGNKDAQRIQAIFRNKRAKLCE